MTSMTAHPTAELVRMRDRLAALHRSGVACTISPCPGCGRGMVRPYTYPACLKCIEREIERRRDSHG